MEDGIAGRTLDVVENDGDLVVLLIEVFQEGANSRSLPEVATTGEVVGEDASDGEALVSGDATAGALLAGDPAVDNGLLQNMGKNRKAL